MFVFITGMKSSAMGKAREAFQRKATDLSYKNHNPTIQKDTFGAAASGALQYRGRSFDNTDAKRMS